MGESAPLCAGGQLVTGNRRKPGIKIDKPAVHIAEEFCSLAMSKTEPLGKDLFPAPGPFRKEKKLSGLHGTAVCIPPEKNFRAVSSPYPCDPRYG